MLNPLQITLPVMLHSDKEPRIFLESKKRIESLGEKYGIPLEIGAFLPFMPDKSRTKESFEKQIENQKKYKLPIRLVETGIHRNNSLAYVPGDPTYNPDISSDLEKTIEQTAKLRDLDPNPSESLVIAPHVGIIVTGIPKADFSIPCFYSPEYFVEHRDEIINVATNRFSQLQNMAKEKGLTFAVENAYLAAVEDLTCWWMKSPPSNNLNKYQMHHQTLNDFNSLKDISKGNMVFDMAHFWAMINLPAQFEKNKDIISPDVLFATMQISSWYEYLGKICMSEDYLKQSHAIHISQIGGIGFKLPPGTEMARRWNGEGKALIPSRAFRDTLKIAQKHNLPVAIEQDYSFSPLDYKEADSFIEPIFKNYLSEE
jgi:hypothetical protein